jgi:hypothetical protein
MGDGGIFCFSPEANDLPKNRRLVLTQSAKQGNPSTSRSLIAHQFRPQSVFPAIHRDFSFIHPIKDFFSAFRPFIFLPTS